MSVCCVHAYIYVTLNKRKQENHLELCPTNIHELLFTWNDFDRFVMKATHI